MENKSSRESVLLYAGPFIFQQSDGAKHWTKATVVWLQTSKSVLRSNSTCVKWLKNCCSRTIFIQPDGSWAVLPKEMGKNDQCQDAQHWKETHWTKLPRVYSEKRNNEEEKRVNILHIECSAYIYVHPPPQQMSHLN